MDAVALGGLDDFWIPCWIPPCGDFDSVLLRRFDFCIDRTAPVVGELAQAKLLEHLHPFIRATLFRIPRSSDPQR